MVNVVYLMPGTPSPRSLRSQFAFVRDTWASPVAPNTGAYIGRLIAGEATAGTLVHCGGRWMRAGLVLFIGFHVGLLFFG